jgi:DUF438 domain-containing protein
MPPSISDFHSQIIKSFQLEMSGRKLEEGHPREYVHTHMNVHENVKKGEEGMSRPTPVDTTSNKVHLQNRNKTKKLSFINF